MANIAIQNDPIKLTPTGFPSIPANAVIYYSGNFGATEGSETTVAIIPVAAYRSVVFSIQALAWGTATVAVKIYSCDSGGNTNANAFFAPTAFTANTGPILLYLSEMGGAVSATTYPPTAVATGSVIGPFGNYIKITEQCTAFTSGTNTVKIEVDLKA